MWLNPNCSKMSKWKKIIIIEKTKGTSMENLWKLSPIESIISYYFSIGLKNAWLPKKGQRSMRRNLLG